MTLIVEDGSGVVGANSYVTASFVTTYLADRNRSTEGSWASTAVAVQDAACIAATDYIENRFRDLFRGVKEIDDTRLARNVLTLTGRALTTETVTIGSIVYRFIATLAAQNDVLLGDNTSEDIDNLIAAIVADPSLAGTKFEATTVANPDAVAGAFYDDSMLTFAQAGGTPGNSVVTTETLTNGSWSFATLNGGSDLLKAQPLSFPRVSLFDRDGNRIVGMPERLKFATAEYAVRALVAALAPDPTIDSLGGNVTRLLEKVGPITTDTAYQAGTANSGTLPAYPAADRLLNDFIRMSGRVIRG